MNPDSKGAGPRSALRARAGQAGGLPHLRMAWIGLLLITILLVGIIRIRLLSFPLERDEGEYAYAGQLILQGIPPYKLVYNMKLPGAYAAYALIMAVFGQTTEGIHLGLLLINLATVALVFFLGKRLCESTPAGAVAAAAYALLSVSPKVMGTAAHATHFVTLAALGGTLLLIRAVDRGHDRKVVVSLAPGPWTLALSGILFGLAFLMKQQGLFFPLFGAVYVLWIGLRKRPVKLRTVIGDPAIFALGAALPFGLTCLVLWWAGVFDKFWFWTFTYARAYVSLMTPRDAMFNFWEQFHKMLATSTALWALAAIGVPLAFWKGRKHCRRPAFLAVFFAFSLLAVVPGFYFRQHYFIPWLPAVALLVGIAVAAAARIRKGWPALGVFALAIGFSLFQQRTFFFDLTPIQACRQVYGSSPFPEAYDIADYISTHSNSDARIAVLGSEPEIYFYAHRHSATGYIYTFPMVENQPYSLMMQKEMIREVEEARPQYMVLAPSWIADAAHMQIPDYILDWIDTYTRKDYTVVCMIDFLSRTQVEAWWGSNAATHRPRSRNFLAIFERK